jgi:hypothetical protein
MLLLMVKHTTSDQPPEPCFCASNKGALGANDHMIDYFRSVSSKAGQNLGA